ncbi:MAG: Gfo/Idh/MocA family oxidoreductase [Fimbriimonas sp.]|nr:Gfo/Idh/MocA family oxidoreductase [Fimbriimonas sp.]
MNSQNKPRLAVIGVGDFYRAILPGIEAAFEVVARIDKSDYAPHPGGLQDHVHSCSPDAVMILTPNQFHAEHVEEVAPLGLPTFVEKPLVTSAEDLLRILKCVEVNPALYCSDFYVDVWGAQLLRWVGMKTAACLSPRTVVDEGSVAWQAGIASIGEIQRVEATLLEGTGPYASFAGREWLWDPTHGGVLWDMAYHHLAMWFTVIDQPLEVLSVKRSTVSSAPPNSSETYGSVEFRSAGGIEFSLRAGKYVETGDDRAFRIYGSKGKATMEFVEPSRLYLDDDFESPLAILTGSRLDLVAPAFREWANSKPTTPYGLHAAIESVNTMLKIRALR